MFARPRHLWLAPLLALVAGCGADRDTTGKALSRVTVADTARPWRKPGDKIDSILPMPEYLRRFRQGLIEPEQFAHGVVSREALAREFLKAVSRRDTAALGKLLITRAEFAWLIFPQHRYAAPPYELDPAVFWMQLQARSQTGFHRVLERFGGKSLSLAGLDCRRDTLQVVKPQPAGLVIWSPCRIRYRVSFPTGDSTFTRRLFGSIVVRDSRAKFLTYANDF